MRALSVCLFLILIAATLPARAEELTPLPGIDLASFRCLAWVA